jgi:Cof subfamily protein (haloacid dehalogenase superfamily)
MGGNRSFMDFNNIMLFSDMDGTLLNSDSKVSKENKQAVDYFINRGGLFGIATGRSQLNFARFIDDLRINAPCIVYNGSGLYNIETGKFNLLYELPRHKLKSFINHCLKKYNEVMILVYCTDKGYIVSSETRAYSDIVATHQPSAFCRLEEIAQKPWVKALLCGKREDLKSIEHEINEYELQNDIHWVYSCETFLEFLPYGVNKGTGLLKLKEDIEDSCRIYAAGDYDNDIEMLKAADVGIATGNAAASLKEIADVITVSNNENAIANIIYEIINNGKV